MNKTTPPTIKYLLDQTLHNLGIFDGRNIDWQQLQRPVAIGLRHPLNFHRKSDIVAVASVGYLRLVLARAIYKHFAGKDCPSDYGALLRLAERVGNIFVDWLPTCGRDQQKSMPLFSLVRVVYLLVTGYTALSHSEFVQFVFGTHSAVALAAAMEPAYINTEIRECSERLLDRCSIEIDPLLHLSATLNHDSDTLYREQHMVSVWRVAAFSVDSKRLGEWLSQFLSQHSQVPQ